VSLFSRWWWWVVFRFVSLRVLMTIEMCWLCLLQARAAPTVSQFAGSCSGSAEIGASEVVESGPAAVVSLCCASWGFVLHCVCLRAVLLCFNTQVSSSSVENRGEWVCVTQHSVCRFETLCRFRVIVFAVVVGCFSFRFFPCSHYYRDVLVVPVAGACRTNRFSICWTNRFSICWPLQWQCGNRCERGGRKWAGGGGEFVLCKLANMFCIVVVYVRAARCPAL
jgi:hypothetical protein